MARKLREVLCDESGAEVVEFALSVCVWLACVFSIMYGAFALYAAHFVGNAAAEGARYAIVRGSTWSGNACTTTSTLECDAASSDVSNYIAGTLPPGMSASNLTVTATWPGTTSAGATCDTVNGANSPNCLVKVQVNYSFSFPVPFLTENTIPLSSFSEMTISQ
jgi:Flp pilus assembly protein TadG